MIQQCAWYLGATATVGCTYGLLLLGFYDSILCILGMKSCWGVNTLSSTGKRDGEVSAQADRPVEGGH